MCKHNHTDVETRLEELKVVMAQAQQLLEQGTPNVEKAAGLLHCALRRDNCIASKNKELAQGQ